MHVETWSHTTVVPDKGDKVNKNGVQRVVKKVIIDESPDVFFEDDDVANESLEDFIKFYKWNKETLEWNFEIPKY